ncbi:hypothetical protein [Burkholderia gladioli]|uniref:hypothetical protein n=1 Tax=Burkholderia gladioli TaxID=28095 RepID=UPI001FC8B844|nr:hypothetical protein [Burkholderia gladioli]
MLRWLIAILLVANLVALAAIQGLFGPPPAAGAREPWHLAQQVRPQALHTTAVAQAAEQPVVGGPISSAPIESQPLAASSADAASSGDGAASAATPGSAPGSAPGSPPPRWRSRRRPWPRASAAARLPRGQSSRITSCAPERSSVIRRRHRSRGRRRFSGQSVAP